MPVTDAVGMWSPATALNPKSSKDSKGTKKGISPPKVKRLGQGFTAEREGNTNLERDPWVVTDLANTGSWELTAGRGASWEASPEVSPEPARLRTEASGSWKQRHLGLEKNKTAPDSWELAWPSQQGHDILLLNKDSFLGHLHQTRPLGDVTDED